MSKTRIPFKLILTVILTVAIAALAFDVNKHGSFKKSLTGRNLQRYGIIAAWNKSLAKLTAYTSLASAWISKNWPLVRAKIDPWLTTAGTQISAAYKYTSDIVGPALGPVITPVKQWLSERIPPLIDHVHQKLIPLAISFMKDFTNALVAIIVELGRWVQDNLLTGDFSLDNITKIAANSVSSIQSNVGHAVTWVSGKVQSLSA